MQTRIPNFTAGPLPVPKGPSSCNQGKSWLSDNIPFDSGVESSKNQALVGTKVHPRTLVAPLIVPPPYDFQYWRESELTKYPSIINSPRQQDLEASGYISTCRPQKLKAQDVTTHISPQSTNEDLMKQREDDARRHLRAKFEREDSLGYVDPKEPGSAAFIENIMDGMYKDPFGKGCKTLNYDPSFTNKDFKSTCTWGCSDPVPESIGTKQLPFYVKPLSKLSTWTTCNTEVPKELPQSENKNLIKYSPEIIENFSYVTPTPSNQLQSNYTPYSQNTPQTQTPRWSYSDKLVRDDKIGGDNGDYVNKSCGYDPSAPNVGLQVNKCTGPMQSSQGYVNYNKNINTQIVQPGMYFSSDVLQPINSNIGISFNQQLNPQTSTLLSPGEALYSEKDANQYVGEDYVNPVITGEELHNIYDPRATGYASNDRFYIDEMTGQPRFFYDDVDSAKALSYMVRSNVDHIGCFDQTGMMKEGQLDFDYRSMANTEFHESTLDQRTDTQTKLAQMRYSRIAQLREYPIRTY